MSIFTDHDRRKHRQRVAYAKLNAEIDRINARPLLDAERDRLTDEAYAVYNRYIAVLNADNPEYPFPTL